MRFLIDDFKGWSIFEYLWLAVATTIITCLSLYWGDTPLAILSAISNVVCVILVTKGKISNYVWGLLGVVLYAYISYTNRLYGDTMLNALYYAPMQFIGFFMWKRNMESNSTKVESKKLAANTFMAIILVSGCCVYWYIIFLTKLGGQVPLLDASSTVLSIVAMMLMAGQYREQWLFWITVNIVSIMMWANADTTNISALLMWIVFLMNSLLGYYNWSKNNK